MSSKGSHWTNEQRNRKSSATKKYFEIHPEKRTKISEAVKAIWSDPNYRAKYIKRLKVRCLICKIEFEVIPSVLAKGMGKYCSRKCYDISQHKKEKKICPICKKEFETYPAEIRRGNGKYCSKQCRYIAQTTKVKILCKNCKKEFYTTPSQLKKGKGRFCSTSCGKIGEHNPSFNGWISYEPYCPKFNADFKERVRSFQGNECLLCGKTEIENGKKLTVHHVDYDKEVCCNGRPPVFACVCQRHNQMANFNRKRWQYIFHRIIEELFDGKSYYTKEEYNASGV